MSFFAKLVFKNFASWRIPHFPLPSVCAGAGSRSGFPRSPCTRTQRRIFCVSGPASAAGTNWRRLRWPCVKYIRKRPRVSFSLSFHPQSRVGRRGVKASLEKKETRSERVTIEKESESIGIAPKICGEQVCVLKISLLWPLGPGPK